ncbi:efflux RND transporter periplasmic adaptor subunit [Denitromonas iodatirespirans]|uniref:Efflux RND transporter periplasmic adaptor subunit n=1 Tax=Denitromonas iodatirespirans TaxID=2795389 RepID=A0A944HDW0_DENI1|nr:efflux RND transporter periplasmic adaptor subunit [Denitromonas iodatirespirans]MBT0964147.1 efflux RND transporter periplasmic adaptor subunit [Denitromonas iodatirespirans]
MKHLNKFRALLGVSAVMVIPVLLSGCEDAESGTVENTNAAVAKAPQSALSVSLVAPQREKWSDRIVATGSIEPWQAASIGAEISGERLVEVLVAVGDTVKKGQLLARLTQESTQVELQMQRASLAEAEANLGHAKLSAERARRLDASRAISAQDLLEYETGEKTAEAKVAIVKSQIAALNLRLRKTKIVAPDDGVISERNATVGSLTDHTPELFRLIRQGRIEWRAELWAEQQAAVKIGQLVWLIDPLGRQVEGRVRQIAPTVDNASRKSIVYVDVEGSDVLKPGVLVTGAFSAAERQALTIPESALVTRDGFNYVMVHQDDGRVAQRKLAIGSRNDGRVEVRSGLTGEERIVESGAAFLNDGETVTVVGDAEEIKVSLSAANRSNK